MELISGHQQRWPRSLSGAILMPPALLVVADYLEVNKNLAYKKLKYWFDKDLAILLSEKIQEHCESFNAQDFIREVADGTKNLELKDRVEFIADQLQVNLPTDYTQALDILLQILGPENKNETGMFSEYYWIMPIAKYVEKF